MAIMRRKTKYLKHLDLVHSQQDFLALQPQHKPHPWFYDTRQEFDDPTTIAERYTSLPLFPSIVVMSVQNGQGKSEFCHHFFEVVTPFLQEVSF